MTRGGVDALHYTDIDQQRQAMFQARKNTVLKKAMELAVLCPDCSVGLIVFDASSRLYQYSSVNMDTLLQRYLSSGAAFEQHDTAELLHKNYRRVDEDPLGSEEAAHCARSKRQRVMTEPHGASEATTSSQMFGSTSHRQNGTAPHDIHPTNSTPADFISRDKYPLSPRSNAAFLAIASEFDPPHSPEVAVIFESCQLEQASPMIEHHSIPGISSNPVALLGSIPCMTATHPIATAEQTNVGTSVNTDQSAPAAVASVSMHPSPAPLIVSLEGLFTTTGSGQSDAGCRPLAGTNSADVLLGLAMDLATPDSGTLGISWPSPHAGSANLPFSRSVQQQQQQDIPGSPSGCSGQPAGLEYASEDSMDEGEGMELDGLDMMVQGRGMSISRLTQEEALARDGPEG